MAQLGTPITVLPNDVYDISSDAKVDVGQLAVTADGKKYRYAQAGGTALAAGKLAVTATQVANHEDMAVASAAAVGAKTVTVTLGATEATANQYTCGYLVINNEAGEGIAYRIASHPAAESAASLVVTLEDKAGVQVALTTSSKASLVKNKYSDVVISASDQLDVPVGIPNVEITTEYYGWLQVGGACSALADETLAIGASLTIGDSTGGAVGTADASGEPIVGHAFQAGVDTEYRLVDLCID